MHIARTYVVNPGRAVAGRPDVERAIWPRSRMCTQAECRHSGVVSAAALRTSFQDIVIL